MQRRSTLAAILALPLLAGCLDAANHAAAVGGGPAGQDRLTVGTVQREIRVGMTSADVVGVLGSPNIVSTDERRREVWVYDRIASQQVFSQSAMGASALIIGGAASAGARQTSQRTLTVIIRYDEAGRVRDFSYRQSSF
ncbi:MAG: hypothetical protein NTW56_14210 [Alphaproteobacteria bacterium]|nr:hypothetical protein [Alphaproteobacteria bacterium]